MKKVLLFSVLALALVFTAKAMFSSNQAIVEEPVLMMEASEGEVSCSWCIQKSGSSYCATAPTCKEAKATAKNMAQI